MKIRLGTRAYAVGLPTLHTWPTLDLPLVLGMMALAISVICVFDFMILL
jgi:hypothetical protein